MLKSSFICFVFLLGNIITLAQDKWFLQKIDEKVSVNFPIKPKKLGENQFGGNTKDGTTYVVSIVDFVKAIGMNLTQFNEEVETQGFVEGFMEGFTPTMPNFKFEPVKVIKVKGYPAYYIVGRHDGTNQTVFMTMIFVDGISYNLVCTIVDNRDPSSKDKFIAGEIYFNNK